jgi:hypothetical protein
MSVRAKIRLKKEFDWSLLADQTIDVYNRVWSEFLTSYWVEGTVWPLSPGAEERAKKLRLEEKAADGTYVERPRPRSRPGLPNLASIVEDEEEAEEELSL